jgi:AraC family ethanolamine operon transcriptional activator
MKKKIPDPEPLVLKEGYFSDRYYDSAELMAQSINNWKQHCPYQLQPEGLSGQHRILQLHNMQIAYAQRNGGTMHNAGAPKDRLAIAVVEVCKGVACFGRFKIKAGDILFFDDSHMHNFITSDSIQFSVISIKKKKLEKQLFKFSNILDHLIHDTDGILATTLHHIWKRFTDPLHKDTEQFIEAEDEILSIVMKLLSEQTPHLPKLRPGEETALQIRDRIFNHMDGNINIKDLAKEYEISEQTLQNSFKSLFGFTPKHFFRILKLNLIHQELQKSSPDQTTVLKVAYKWGFKHMGRFAYYYKELFSENPSQTLKTICCEESNLEHSCVSRKEEIE